MHSFAWWPITVLTLLASITDLKSRRVPNWLVFPFLIAGVVANLLIYGREGIARTIGGVALAVALCGVMYWMGGLGAGDLKLCAAIGAWIGPQQLFIAQVVTGIVGGLWVVLWALCEGFADDLFRDSGDLAFGWVERGSLRNPELTIDNVARRSFAYAPAIAIGTLISFFAG